MICRADLHLHTDRSPDGRASLDALCRAAAARGLHAVAITDHNYFHAKLPAELEGVLIIPGCEFSTESGHITGLFLKRAPRIPAHALYTAEAAIEEIHRCGGFAVAAHPFQRCDPPPVPRADGIEAFNARAALKVRNANALAAAHAEKAGLPAVGASDAHSAKEVGNGYTELNVAARTAEALEQALRAGLCRAVAVREATPLQKGLSQFKKARRSKSPAKILIGLAYLGKCLITRR